MAGTPSPVSFPPPATVVMPVRVEQVDAVLRAVGDQHAALRQHGEAADVDARERADRSLPVDAAQGVASPTRKPPSWSGATDASGRRFARTASPPSGTFPNVPVPASVKISEAMAGASARAG